MPSCRGAVRMFDFVFWLPVMAGGALAGASSGLLGTFIVGMRIPFLGVCVAHAALAGAVFGSLGGLAGQALLLPALGASVLTALALGLLDPQRVRLDDNAVLSFLFSATMGLAFLGIGLHGILGRSDNDVRSMLWGSLNFCRWRDVGLMLASSGAVLAYIVVFFKELRAIMFSRADAEAAGIRVKVVWSGFLVLVAAVLTVNFQTVGGLMIYSLISNPAAAAFQLVKSCRRTLAVSAVLGAASGLGGFLISAATDLPSGAVIVLVSSVLLALAAIVRRCR
ncbi:MAG TPA: metal ABC transporter permease [Verrucomicrobiota bacterium]|nr:metal ABC transporter permease [Verrucomicrobiota bacterium]HOC51371.1 metal ABC transporter permease [Verrucomicrobiota bacterium]HOH41447.1 metal ABC transporter permease [Verrucomicrobiota bacterium]HOX64124.1 metal ABC transporter permease [Verrucomicrobiota bacterium]HPI66482.1 metal ABC transporter permease [Verrucomicrobiota bacterium]